MKTNKILNQVFGIEGYIFAALSVMALNSFAIFRVSKYSQILSVFLAGYGMCAVLSTSLRKDWNFKFSKYQLAILILLASILSFVGNSFRFPVKNIYSIVSIFVNFFVFLPLMENRENNSLISRIFKFIFYITILINILNLIMFVFNISIPYGTSNRFMGVDPIRKRFSGLSGNTNGLGRVGLSSIYSMVLYRVYYKKKEFNKLDNLIHILAFVLNLFIIFLSQSRGGILAILISCLFFLASYLAYFLRNVMSNKLALIVTLILTLVLSFLAFNNLSTLSGLVIDGVNNGKGDAPIVDRNDSESDDVDITNGRVVLIKNGVKATIEKNPLFGLSYGGNKFQIQSYLDEHNIKVSNSIYNGAGSMHNTFVQFFVNTGIFGIIPFILLILITLFNAFRITFFNNEINRNLISALNAVFSGLFVLNIVEWIFYFDYDNHFVNFIMMVVIGAYLYVGPKKRSI